MAGVVRGRIKGEWERGGGVRMSFIKPTLRNRRQRWRPMEQQQLVGVAAILAGNHLKPVPVWCMRLGLARGGVYLREDTQNENLAISDGFTPI